MQLPIAEEEKVEPAHAEQLLSAGVAAKKAPRADSPALNRWSNLGLSKTCKCATTNFVLIRDWSGCSSCSNMSKERASRRCSFLDSDALNPLFGVKRMDSFHSLEM